MLIVGGPVLGADSMEMVCGEIEMLEGGEEGVDENETPLFLFAGPKAEGRGDSPRWGIYPQDGSCGGFWGLDLLRRYCRLLV